MRLTRIPLKFFTLFPCIMLLVACGSLPTIATNVTYCCQPGAATIATFRVEFEDMPEFLKPMLRDAASVVLSTKGVQYTEGDADAVLHMKFVNKTLQRNQEDVTAWERIAPGGGVRFIAQVVLEMTNSVTGELIWSGSMQRIHNVYEGSYMHDAPAKAAMRDALLELLVNYPGPRSSTG